MRFNVNLFNAPAGSVSATVAYDSQPPQSVTISSAGNSTTPAMFTAVASGSQTVTVTYFDANGNITGTETATVPVTGTTPGEIQVMLAPGTGGVTLATVTLVCSDVENANGTLQFTTDNGATLIATATVTAGVVSPNPVNLGVLATGTAVTVTFVPANPAISCTTCLFPPVTVTVGACQVILTATPMTVSPGGTVTATVQVLCNGVGVVGATVLLTGGASPVTLTTGANGLVTGTVTFNTSGTLSAIVTSVPTGETTCTDCVGAFTIVTIQVTVPTSCQVLLVPSSTTVAAGGSISVTALVLCNGVGIPNATVVLTGGASPVTLTTNANGLATGTVTFNSAGTATLTATVNATGTACTCTNVVTTVAITVTPTPTCQVQLVVPDPVIAGKPTQVAAIVTCNGQPVPNASIVFTGGLTPVNATTNASGIAVATVTFPTAGPATLTATVTATGIACTCTNVQQNVLIIVVPPSAPKLVAFPACWELNLPFPFPHVFKAKLHARITPPQAGIKIDFYVGDDFVGSAFTDATGTAILDAGLSPLQIVEFRWSAVAVIGSTRLRATNILLPCIPPV